MVGFAHMSHSIFTNGSYLTDLLCNNTNKNIWGTFVGANPRLACRANLHLVLQRLHVPLLHQLVDGHQLAEALGDRQGPHLPGQVQGLLQGRVQWHLCHTGTHTHAQTRTHPPTHPRTHTHTRTRTRERTHTHSLIGTEHTFIHVHTKNKRK